MGENQYIGTSDVTFDTSDVTFGTSDVTFDTSDVTFGTRDVSTSWTDNFDNPADMELVEVKVVLPKIIWDRFSDPKTFLGNKVKKNNGHSPSKRLARFLLNYHKLVNTKEANLIKDYLDLREVTRDLNKYTQGTMTFEDVVQDLENQFREVSAQ